MPTRPIADLLHSSESAVIRSESRPTCCCCGSTGSSLYRDLTDNLFSAPGSWSLKKCDQPDCGMVWLDPMPLQDDLAVAYKDYYTHGDKRSRSMLFTYSKYLYRLFVDGLLMMGGVPFERRRAALMFVGDRKPARLLDVGCGQGKFLALMQKRGWSVMGIDFDKDAVEAARKTYGVDARVGTVDTMLENDGKFDVITASHVIEHVYDPIDFLSKCRNHLRAGGCMVLRTPNIESLGHRRYGRFWRGLEPPRHLNLFTARALDAMARQSGFGLINCFTSSVAAEGILTASQILEEQGQYPASNLTTFEQIRYKLLPPVLGLKAKGRWLLDRSSGEEICAVLTNVASASAE